MATYTMDSYQKVWAQRAKAIKRNANKSAFQAARYMMAQAQSMTPRKTGATRAGIRKRKSGNAKYMVTSTVPGPFKQNMWANQTAPFRTIHPWWNNGKPTVYGDGSHRITGKPRFFHFATLRTKEKFPKITRANNLKALQVTIG